MHASIAIQNRPSADCAAMVSGSSMGTTEPMMLNSMCSSTEVRSSPGAVVRVGQQQTKRKGVEKLLQIGVIQAEQQCRNEGARLLPVPRKTAGQQTAEHQLLAQRTDDAGTENDGRHRHLRKALVHHADRIASGQSVDHVVDIRADERTSHISAQPMTNQRPMRFAPARSLQNGIGGVLRHIQNTIGSDTA